MPQGLEKLATGVTMSIDEFIKIYTKLAKYLEIQRTFINFDTFGETL